MLQQLGNELNPDPTDQGMRIVFYNLDTVVLDSTSTTKYEVIDDMEFNRKLDSIRYELVHLHRKIDLHTESAFSAFMALDNAVKNRHRLTHKILQHVAVVKEQIEALLKSPSFDM